MLSFEEQRDGFSELSFSRASEIVELVVLTADDMFLQTLRGAVSRARRVWHVASADQVSDLLVAGEVGILIIDMQALQGAAEGFVSQIKRQFPDLVIIVAGQRGTEGSLGALISSGIVHRFIHKPLSPGRARSFADAAVRKYDEQRRRAEPRHPRKLPGRVPRLGMLVVLLVLVTAVIAAWALNR